MMWLLPLPMVSMCVCETIWIIASSKQSLNVKIPSHWTSHQLGKMLLGVFSRTVNCKIVLLLMYLGSSSGQSLKTEELTNFLSCSLLFTTKNTLISDLVA